MGRDSLTRLVVSLVLLVGCDRGVLLGAPGSAEPASGADGGAASSPAAPAPVERTTIMEVCGNGLDDDRNGEIDEHCDCAPDATQACWPGAPVKRGVGACGDGVQRCVSQGEFGYAWGECVGYFLAAPEIADNGVDEDCDGIGGMDNPCTRRERGAACGDGIDGDCDGVTDCDDPDCDAEMLCMPDDPDPMTPTRPTTMAACPAGEVPTYDAEGFCSSGITAGPVRRTGEPECRAGRCPTGQVSLGSAVGWFEESDVPRDGASLCVPAPPRCPRGTYPDVYQSYETAPGSPLPTGDGSGGYQWRCSPLCGADQLTVQYGFLFECRPVCTDPPSALDCPMGQVPTFVLETQAWECRRTCDNSTYDQVTTPDGTLVCVPC